MIIIKSLELVNFMVFKKFKRVFHDKKVIGIAGENMSGKTVCIEAIYCAITGKSRYKKMSELIHYGQDEGSIKLVLLDTETNEEHVIKRCFDSKGNNTLSFNAHDQKVKGQEAINNLLNIEPDDLELTSFFKAGEINSFMEKDPSEKKKFLMRWFQRDHWEELEKLAKEEKEAAQKDIKSVEMRVQVLSSQLINVDDMKDKCYVLESDNKKDSLEIDQLKKEIDSIKSSMKMTKSEYLKTKQDIQRKRSAKESLKEDIEEIEESVRTELEPLRKFLTEQKRSYVENKKHVDGERLTQGEKSQRIGELSVKIRELKSNIETSKTKRTGICPILNEECSKVKFSIKQIELWEADIRSFSSDKQKLQEAIQKFQDRSNFILDYDKKSMALSVLEEKVKGIEKDKSQVKELSDDIVSLEESLSKFNPKALEDIDELEYKICNIQSAINKRNKEIGSLQSSIKAARDTGKEIEELNLKLAEMKDTYDDLSYVANMFGKNGIPSLEIENGFKEITHQVNSILDSINLPLSVDMSPDRETNEWEIVCHSCGFSFPKGYRKPECECCEAPRRKKRKDELTFNVIEQGNENNFQGISSGGKMLISMSMRVILARMLMANKNARLGVLFLDEIDAHLDEKNTEALKNFVMTVLIDVFKFKQVFWVSHKKAIKNHLDNVLLIKKNGVESSSSWI